MSTKIYDFLICLSILFIISQNVVIIPNNDFDYPIPKVTIELNIWNQIPISIIAKNSSKKFRDSIILKERSLCVKIC